MGLEPVSWRRLWVGKDERLVAGGDDDGVVGSEVNELSRSRGLWRGCEGQGIAVKEVGLLSDELAKLRGEGEGNRVGCGMVLTYLFGSITCLYLDRQDAGGE